MIYVYDMQKLKIEYIGGVALEYPLNSNIFGQIWNDNGTEIRWRPFFLFFRDHPTYYTFFIRKIL